MPSGILPANQPVLLPLTIGIPSRQQYQKLRKEGIQTTGSTSTPNTPQQNRIRAIQPTGMTKSPTRRGRPRGKRVLVDRHVSDGGEDDDEGDGGKKKIKREAEQSEYQPRMMVKTEPVDEEGVIDLEEDELST